MLLKYFYYKKYFYYRSRDVIRSQSNNFTRLRYISNASLVLIISYSQRPAISSIGRLCNAKVIIEFERAVPDSALNQTNLAY